MKIDFRLKIFTMQNKIFIYGVPGSGKTYFSKLLKEKLNWPLLEADTLRPKAQKDKTVGENPFLFLGTCQAYKKFGELNPENTVKGLKAVREALQEWVLSEVERHTQVVVESAFLDPNIISNRGEVLLVITKDEALHKSYFFQNRSESEESLNEFKAARLVQDYLIEEAEKLNIKIIENNSDIRNKIEILIK